MAIRKAGIPAPRVISHGEHSWTPWAPVSILMTRLPGVEFDEIFPNQVEPLAMESITDDLRTILNTTRSWQNPWGFGDGRKKICNASGGRIRSVRVPNHAMSPFESEQVLNDYLLSTASTNSFATQDEYNEAIATARKMNNFTHSIVFTHGDFALHNVLVHDGRVLGLIDWECAGWYPEHWEFSTPLRWASQRPEWRDLLMRLRGEGYERELECEIAIQSLTVDSWIF